MNWNEPSPLTIKQLEDLSYINVGLLCENGKVVYAWDLALIADPDARKQASRRVVNLRVQLDAIYHPSHKSRNMRCYLIGEGESRLYCQQ